MREYTHLNHYSNYQTRVGTVPPIFQDMKTKTQREIRILVAEDEDPLREL